MKLAEQQFMALDGLVQWTSAVIAQSDRLANAKMSAAGETGNMIGGRLDYDSFTEAAKRLLLQQLKEPTARPAPS